MASLLARGKAVLARVRQRSALVDHAIRMQLHYGKVNGSAQAGAVTYFAFLSIFPILALAFFVVGYVARVYPQARDNLIQAIGDVLPGISNVSLDSIERSAATLGIIGVVGVLYSGLGWLSGMRTALGVVFAKPQDQQPNFFVGKLRDLLALVLVGLVLMVSVAVTGVVVTDSGKVLDLLGLSHHATVVIQLVGAAAGVATNLVLLLVMFRLLARPDVPRRSLRQGALVGAIGIEVLKQLSSHLLSTTKDNPGVQALGIALILLIWINYFSRVVMYAAAWAYTSPRARAARDAVLTATPVPATVDDGPTPVADDPDGSRTRVAFAAGAAAALGLVALVRRRRR